MIISGRSLCFIVVLAFVFTALATAVAYYYLRSRRRRSPYGQWEALLSRLTIVDPDKIGLIGGLTDLEVMERNCAVLVDLAFYVQQWYPEASLVAEQLRLDARKVEWHVGRLKGAAQAGKLEFFFADYAEPAIATYHSMARRVLALYAQYDLPGLGDLQRAI